MLNDSLTPAQLPADVRAAFTGAGPRRILLPGGTLLYKFTSHPLFHADGTVTPWWSAVEPLAPTDTGLAGLIERAERMGVPPERFARARSAVTQQWNSMQGLLIVRLSQSVYGFAGRCSAQRTDQTLPVNVVFIGGAWQVYIPHLSSLHVERA